MKKFLYSLGLLLIASTAMSQESFNCGDGLKDPRDGKTYKTILIGSQCWMAENLNFGEVVVNHEQKDNGVAEKTCYLNNPENCDIYGGLYTWNEAMNWDNEESSRGICPEGWHLPSKSEWETLSNFLGADSAGQKMKVKPENDPSWDGNNESGFSALPAGGGYDKYFHRINSWALFWTSTANEDTRAWFTQLDNYWYPAPPKYLNLIMADYYLKTNGLSVRCIKDED